MGLQGAGRPKSLERKYDSIPEHRKLLYYLFRRHLNMPRSEVDRLPWWEERYLIEQMNREFAPPDEDDDAPGATEDHDDISDLGFTVHAV